MTKFITIAGRKQVGKDTSAKYIKNIIESEDFRTKVRVVHFADALKDACSIIFGIPRTDMETEIGKQKLTKVKWPHYEDNPGFPNSWSPDADGKFMTVREVLQFVGTDLFRTQMDPDIWVQSVFRQNYSEDVVVIADCRFPNEADIAKENGLLIQVKRETGLESDAHISESALDDYQGFDISIDNNGSFEDLRQAIKNILSNNGILV